jgi:broad specificity phosphatase PhoE
MKKIYILKDGESNFNDSLMSKPENLELNNNGIEQAKKTGLYFKNFRDPIEIIICSPTLRAKQTADIIADNIGYDKKNIILEPNLIEIQINNKYKNLKKEEFNNLKNTDADVIEFFKFHDKKNKIKAPIELNEFLIKYDSTKKLNIYENSESIYNRLNSIINMLKNMPLKNILIISHGSTINWLNKIITNNIGYDEFKGKMIQNNNCSITYYIEQNNELYLVSPNSNKHLEI